jgi:hypothetical protein
MSRQPECGFAFHARDELPGFFPNDEGSKLLHLTAKTFGGFSKRTVASLRSGLILHQRADQYPSLVGPHFGNIGGRRTDNLKLLSPSCWRQNRARPSSR